MAAVIPLGSDAATAVNWRRFGVLVTLLAGTLALYSPAVRSLCALWLDSGRTTYTHGFLIAAVCAWLIWRAAPRASLPDIQPTSTLTYFSIALLLGGCAFAWQLSYRAGIQLGVVMLLPPLIWLAVRALMGRNAAAAMLMPLVFLGFALPFWDLLNPLLQSGSIHAVRLMLRVAGVPAYFSGSIVQIPSGTFEIEGGCSGLHFFVVALAIGALMGELRNDGWRQRLRWLLVAAVLAVVVNWIRIFTVILAGHLSDMQNYLVRESHYGYGWVLFSIALVALFLIERRTPLRQVARGVTPLPASVSAVPARAWQLATIVIIALPAMLDLIISARPAAEMDSGPAVAQSAHWRRVPTSSADWAPVQQGADREFRYRLDGDVVELYGADYHEQRLGKKLGGEANRPQGAAEVIEKVTVEEGDSPFTVLRVDEAGRHSLLLVTYRVAEREFAAATRAQLWYSWLSLRSLRSVSSSIRVLRSRCIPDCETARAALEHFHSNGGDRF